MKEHIIRWLIFAITVNLVAFPIVIKNIINNKENYNKDKLVTIEFITDLFAKVFIITLITAIIYTVIFWIYYTITIGYLPMR